MMNRVSPPQKLEIGVLYGFRAIMVLMVANFHFWQQSWLSQGFRIFGQYVDFDYITRSGYVFVDGLILLSGFLLFLPHAQSMMERTAAPNAKRFYFNRLVRILPSYAAGLLIVLFCFALPQGSYQNESALALDVITHLTLTFPFFQQTYLFTPLNGVLWTVAIEMQLYLIFPLLAKAARKKPALTLSLMAVAGWLYRLIIGYKVSSTAMFINQMPAFLDVYALGMAGAMGYLWLKRWMGERTEGQRALLQGAAVVVLAFCIWMVLELLRVQSKAGVQSVEALRLSQMKIRLPLCLAFMGCMLSAATLPRALGWLFSNRLMRFLSTISFNFYIWHQVLAVQYARYWFPSTLHTEQGLQWAFTALCYCSSIVVASIFTYGLEQPVSKWFHQLSLHREEA
ncbi:MAG: acyltransferase [Eubacteriales bacterium]|nr:acyltransferase [Eubacteriales bacterium]